MLRKVSKNNVSFNVKNEKEFWDDFEYKNWEDHTFRIIDNFLSSDSIILDIGALNGVISMYCASRGGKVYSFEPDPVALKNFQANLSANPNLQHKINLVNKAITADGKVIKLFSRWEFGDSGSSILNRVKSTNNVVEVQSITINDFEKKYGIKNVDFVKMDIEGAEFFVIDTFIDFLKEYKPVFYLSLHYNSLLEYYEKKIFSSGLLRRVYRSIDSNKSFLRKKVDKHYKNLFKSLSFYTYLSDHNLGKINIDELNHNFLEQLDSVVFSMAQPNKI